jgi:hypothetical protein
MSQTFTTLTLSEASQKGWELTQILARKAHLPANVKEMQNAVADRCVVLHAAGNSRAITIGIFEANSTPAAVEAAITALV